MKLFRVKFHSGYRKLEFMATEARSLPSFIYAENFQQCLIKIDDLKLQNHQLQSIELQNEVLI